MQWPGLAVWIWWCQPMSDFDHRTKARHDAERAITSLKVGALESAEQHLRSALYHNRQAQIEACIVHTERV